MVFLASTASTVGTLQVDTSTTTTVVTVSVTQYCVTADKTKMMKLRESVVPSCNLIEEAAAHSISDNGSFYDRIESCTIHQLFDNPQLLQIILVVHADID